VRRARWTTGLGSATALIVLLALAGPSPAAGEPAGDLADPSAWTAGSSPGATAEIAREAGPDGRASLRVDFDLGMGGFVIVRRPVSITLPENYAFSFRIRGNAPVNNLELKLVDPKSDDVWWAQERDFEFASEWQRIVLRKSRFAFAWGASGGKPLARAGFLELAITSGSGGRGSVWIDDLRFEPRPAHPPSPAPPRVSASTSAPGQPGHAVLDGDPATRWQSGAVAEQQWLQLDLGGAREFGGIVVDWDPEDYPTAFRVALSDDGREWVERYRTDTASGRRSYIYLRDAEARFVRILLDQPRRTHGYGVRDVRIEPPSFATTPNDFFAAIAREARPGFFPKYLLGKQSYWTVIGVGGDPDEALLNEEGVLEAGKGGFSIEPFVFTGGRLVTWRDVAMSHGLERGDLPLPTVWWKNHDVGLEIAPVATGAPRSSTVWVRYRVTNHAALRRDVLLHLALRPFQVLPPWQTLNVIGGARRVRDVAFAERTATIDGARRVVALTPPAHFGATTFEDDLVANYLRHGRVPQRTSVHDPFGYAAGAFEYRLSLDPGASSDVVLAIPLHAGSWLPPAGEDPGAVYARERAAAAAQWQRELDRVDYVVPEADEPMIRAARSTLAYLEINRDGPAIQPGSRTYARSWIRDGAYSSMALLDAGHTEEVREFLRWYATFQLADGRIPCCVDRRGADRVPENDSEGEFLFTLAEYYRYTRDVGFVYELWPNAVRAVEAIAALRARRLTPEYDQDEKLPMRGLLPESISHEGYSGHPVHAYWDDFFALRGLGDAAMLARVVGDPANEARWSRLRDEFRDDLYASIALVMERRKLSYLPASADLGDFDATSTAAAILPVGELGNLPPAALAATFDQYLGHVRQRASRPPGEEGYTPYEFRNVSALVQMGRRDDAWWLLQLLLKDRRPLGWNAWAEVVWRDPALPRFIGDMPHTWVGASFLHAVRSLFFFERASDGALVLAAGMPPGWLVDAPGVGVERLPTPHGVLSYRLRRDGTGAIVVDVAGDLRLPAAGIVLDPPLPGPVTRVVVNGTEQARQPDGEVVVHAFPATVRLEWNVAAPPTAAR